MRTTFIGGAGNDTMTGGTQAGGTGNNVFDGGLGADTIVGGNESDLIIYDPADVSYDFLLGGSSVDFLQTRQDLDLGNPGPTIANMDVLFVPDAATGPTVALTIDPADVTATARGAILVVDPFPSPFTGPTNATLTGAGWTQNGTTTINTRIYDVFEVTGALGAPPRLIVSQAILVGNRTITP